MHRVCRLEEGCQEQHQEMGRRGIGENNCLIRTLTGQKLGMVKEQGTPAFLSVGRSVFPGRSQSQCSHCLVLHLGILKASDEHEQNSFRTTEEFFVTNVSMQSIHLIFNSI